MKTLFWSFLILILSQPLVAQDNLCEKTKLLVEAMEDHHYVPRPANASLSSDFFDALIETLDPIQGFFLQSDIEEFEAFRTTLFESVATRTCELKSLILPVYQKRLEQSLTRLDALEKKRFKPSEKVDYSRVESEEFCTSEEELVELWEASYHWQTLEEVAYLEDLDRSRLEVVMEEEKLKLIEKSRCRIKSIMESAKSDSRMESLFLNTLATCYDPHSSFFNVDTREIFESALTTEYYGLGIGLEIDDDGKLLVTSLTPGGPAWRSNQLNVGDQITELLDDEKNPVDLNCISYSTLREVLNQPNSGVIEMEYKKKGGESGRVLLRREKITRDEKTLRSFIIKDDQPIGYIALPDFYTHEDSPYGLGCANDVAKEILKLKKENIEGLILDLRYNGGGYAKEALELAGIFIDYGPLALIRDKGEDPQLLKDINRGSIFRKPLIILVNEYSASASELTAAMLRDYNRAIIVGNQTYGKGSGQNLFPVDITNEDFGFAKITKSMFYRIDGNSYQEVGIHPDIELPALFPDESFREVDEPHRLKTSRVDKKVYSRPGPELPLEMLQTKSQSRIESEAYWQKLLTYNDSLQNFDMPTVASLEDFLRYVDFEDRYVEATENKVSLKVALNSFSDDLVELDATEKSITDRNIEQIQTDAYIRESYLILIDLITNSQ